MNHNNDVLPNYDQSFELWTPTPDTVLTKQVKRHTLTMHPTVPTADSRYIECTISSTTGTSLVITDETVEVAMASLDDYKAMFELVAVVRCPNCFHFLLWERDATMVPPLCQECADQGLVQLISGEIVLEYPLDITIVASVTNFPETFISKGCLYEDGTVIARTKFRDQDTHVTIDLSRGHIVFDSYLMRMPDGSERPLDPTLLTHCYSNHYS